MVGGGDVFILFRFGSGGHGVLGTNGALKVFLLPLYSEATQWCSEE